MPLIQTDDQSPENFDQVFSPDVIADLRRIAAELDAGGKRYSMAEAQVELNKLREEWLASRSRTLK